MHSKSNKREIMVNDKADKVIEEIFQATFSRYQIGLETTKKGTSFIFDYVNLLYYKCHKVNPKHGGSYKDSPNWIRSRKAAIDPINEIDNKCFQHASTFALNHKEIAKDSGKIAKFRLLIGKYN